MARIKLLLFAAIALGLMVWNLMSVPAPAPAAHPTAAPAPSLDGAASGVRALLEARSAWERAAAQSAITSAPLETALASAAKNGGTPGNDAAEPLKAAADQALASFPQGARQYVVVALATATGALASVPGHEPLTAASFPWIDEALKAGPTGYAANVAGKKVVVYAAPIRALVKDEVKDLGSLAIAFSREPADWAPFVDSSPVPFTLISGGKVVASNDKAHADAVKSLSAAGPASISGGAALAVPVPGLDGALAIVATSAPAAAASAPAAMADPTGNLKISLGILVIAAIVFAVLMGGDPVPAPAPLPSPSQVRVGAEDLLRSSLPATAPPVPAPAPLPAAPPPPAAAPVAAAPKAPEPPPPAPSPLPSPPPLPAPMAHASSDKVPGFDELFGSAQPATRPPSTGIAAASAPAASTTDPLGFLSGSPPPGEATATMSRAQVSSLAAQAAQPQADVVALPPTSQLRPADPDAIPLPSAAAAPDPFALAGGGDPPPEQHPHERTVVAAVPQELLRAAGQRPSGSNGVGVAGPMAASANAEELHYQDVYREFLQVRERCGEPQENLTFEKFSAKLRKNKEQLVQKYACKSVRFQVYVKEGKAALKATPVKEG